MLALSIHARDSAAFQFDMPGPPGSQAFGAIVKVLPNGNTIVVDPAAPPGQVGAVYLYDTALTLISTLTGSTANDQVGSGGVVVVGNGNFVVLSPHWSNGSASESGAVTWVSGATGLSGVVSSDNSLVGSSANDAVGNYCGVKVLSNGNYVVGSCAWSGARGAATWGSGASGTSGLISAANSIVGGNANDQVGLNIFALTNGNYVVGSPNWNSNLGAATWANGFAPTAGVVSIANSLVGIANNDSVGAEIAVLSNGNYVASSRYWNHGLGAATWGNGAVGIHGDMSADNSLIGSSGDWVGWAVTPLSNGNYVVASPYWNGDRGAITWGDGAAGVVGTVSSGNSLVGAAANDTIGFVTALSNGNYVVGSFHWNGDRGAVTWCSGASAATGTVSAANSLTGTIAGDGVGIAVTALKNGNFVVSSPSWNTVGAATWADGTMATTGVVSANNSLVGSAAHDAVGSLIVALGNGNYVVGSPSWSGDRGAVTWGNGTTGVTGMISSGNSFVGVQTLDAVGNVLSPLSNGNYVIGSLYGYFGAVTWGDGATGTSGAIGAGNSLLGVAAHDVAPDGIAGLGDGNYVIHSANWNGGRGAMTWASGTSGLAGTIESSNSVLRLAVGGGSSMNFSYDAARKRLVVGRPADNMVSLFVSDQIFAAGFE